MIDRVARATFAALNDTVPGSEDRAQIVGYWAIKAMREPSQSVLDCRPPSMSVKDARAMWQTMIDAATGDLK